jgi:mono/diheme cytochrome c family protein
VSHKLVRLFVIVAVVGALMIGMGSADAATGAVFVSNCAVCHQPNAHGVPGVYPPLADQVGKYVHLKEGRAYLIKVLSFGMTGKFESNGSTYDGYMPSWPQLSDMQIAEALNEVLTMFNERLLPKDFAPLTAVEVAKYRAKPLSTSQVFKARQELMKALDKTGAAK